MKVEQFINKNQFHLYSDDCMTDILQSYQSTVVKIKRDLKNNITITLGLDWDYSNTTSKHVYKFLEEYGNINFNGVSNKKQYIKKLIEDDIIQYDGGMR